MSTTMVKKQEHIRDAKQGVRSLRPGPKRQSNAQAMASTFAQYDQTMRVLAETPIAISKS